MSSLSFDTNILIYSIDLRDARKHAIAKELVKRCGLRNTILALQCLSEFYRASTRKRILSSSLAYEVVEEARGTFQIVPPSEADLVHALKYHQSLKLQFFDALIWATMERAGCTLFFSEDLQHKGSYGALRVHSPFAEDFRMNDFF